MLAAGACGGEDGSSTGTIVFTAQSASGLYTQITGVYTGPGTLPATVPCQTSFDLGCVQLTNSGTATTATNLCPGNWTIRGAGPNTTPSLYAVSGCSGTPLATCSGIVGLQIQAGNNNVPIACSLSAAGITFDVDVTLSP
jgi:hypothetical protein